MCNNKPVFFLYASVHSSLPESKTEVMFTCLAYAFCPSSCSFPKRHVVNGFSPGATQTGNNYGMSRGRGIQKKLKRKDRGRGRGANKGPEEVNGMEVTCVILKF